MAAPPEPGAIAHVRGRRWLVEDAAAPPRAGEATLVSLSCIDDDAQGQPLRALWEHEVDARVLEDSGWAGVAEKGFDDPELFAAWLRAISWNCVTATDPDLFQAPFRAGIRIEAWQLAPLRKALRLPRVNLFIADDVGLGKTIEAGLIARELLLRRRIDRIVAACPPAMLEQWRDEMEARFGLSFVILDRAWVARMRRERGFAVNPWTLHSRFLVSHRLLADEAYASGLRDWLGEFAPRSLLILDEAHHAAPASGARYAVDSRMTRAVRELAPLFEHRLFLSATPHNGHSNSFSALLEILDPQRFCRGVKVLPGQLEDVMTRRLKSDVRALAGGFPERVVERIDIDGLPDDAPELELARRLDAYRAAREKRLADAPPSRRAVAALVAGNLQKRLLSSIDAFARTLAVHRRSAARALEEANAAEDLSRAELAALEAAVAGPGAGGADDDAPDEDGPDDDAHHELIARATAVSVRAAGRAALEDELRAVDAMLRIAEAHRHAPDPRIREIVAWIDRHMCPVLSPPGGAPLRWTDRRLIVFTEYEDTRRYVELRLREAVAHSDCADERIAAFSGATPPRRREEIKHAFDTEPADRPLRILVATDAAREGLNLQRHCRDLFHFDLPWNPARLDQRNGRIDRKLQPAGKVVCRYFVFRQRPEDRVLDTLARKGARIREELGSAATVLDDRAAARIGKEGLRRDRIPAIARAIDGFDPGKRRATAAAELDGARLRREELEAEIDSLRTRLERSRRHIDLDAGRLRRALSMSLRLAGAPAIAPRAAAAEDAPETFAFPADSAALAADPGWAPVLDALRERRERGEAVADWRRRARIRPVAFDHTGRLGENAVQLHLEHRVAQRLLNRFAAQGLVHHDLSKACLAAAEDAVPRVVLLGRLAVYGPRAARLHEEVVPVAARWVDPARRRGPLAPYGRAGQRSALDSLRAALDAAGGGAVPGPVRDRLAASARADIAALRPHLESRAADALRAARSRLAARAAAESAGMADLLRRQRERIAAEAGKDDSQLALEFDPAERRQRQADRRAWARRLDEIERELETEPARVAESYAVRAHRIDPLGLVYLWPRTG